MFDQVISYCFPFSSCTLKRCDEFKAGEIFFNKMKVSLKLSILLSFLTILLIFYEFRRKFQAAPNFCGRFPRQQDIIVDNVIWQVLNTSKGQVSLLNAYLDRRFNQSVVKINSNGPKLNLEWKAVYCQIWHDEKSQPEVVRVMEIEDLWLKRKFDLNF